MDIALEGLLKAYNKSIIGCVYLSNTRGLVYLSWVRPISCHIGKFTHQLLANYTLGYQYRKDSFAKNAKATGPRKCSVLASFTDPYSKRRQPDTQKACSEIELWAARRLKLPHVPVNTSYSGLLTQHLLLAVASAALVLQATNTGVRRPGYKVIPPGWG